MGTITLIRRRDLESLAAIRAEADLAAAAVVVPDAGDVPALLGAGLPGRGGSALRCVEEGGVAVAGVFPSVVSAAAVVIILEV